MERILEVKDKVGAENSKIKQRLQTVQHDWTYSFKNIAHKANKKARAANRKARKVLGTEDGRPVRNSQVYNCNLNLGYDIFKRFQKKWIMLHDAATKNAAMAEGADVKILSILKQWQLWEETVAQFHRNIAALPDVVAAVEIAQSSIVAVGDQMDKIEDLLLQYEDILERVEMTKEKEGEKLKISRLVEEGQLEYQRRKDCLVGNMERPPVDHVQLERQSSVEKHQTYEDAFVAQMNQFVESGQLDTPIAGSVQGGEPLESITIDESDVSALKEFLGPEELNSVMEALPGMRLGKLSEANCSSNSQDNLDSEEKIMVEVDTESSVTTPTIVEAAVSGDEEKGKAISGEDVNVVGVAEAHVDDDVAVNVVNDKVNVVGVEEPPTSGDGEVNTVESEVVHASDDDDAHDEGENWYDAATET